MHSHILSTILKADLKCATISSHTCLRKEKLIKDVHSGVHKPIIDGVCFARAVWFLLVFASSCRFSPGFLQSHPML